MADPSSDLELVRRFVAGDGTAFEQIVRTHQHRVFAVCRRMLGNAADADDAAQDVFLKAFNGLRGFRPEAALATWLYRIAVNACIDRRRRPFFRALLRRVADGAGEEVVDVPSRDPSPERLLEAKQIARAIDAALARLSPKLRAAIVLKELEGLSYEEIAEVLEVSLGTVKSRISRARDELQRLLSVAREQ